MLGSKKDPISNDPSPCNPIIERQAKKIFLKRLSNGYKPGNGQFVPPNPNKIFQAVWGEQDIHEPPLHQNRDNVIKYYFGEGLKLYYNGEYKKAIICFRTVLQFDPDHDQSLEYIHRARNNIAKVY